MTSEMMKGQFPSVSLCGMVFIELFQHVEKYVNDDLEVRPEWLKSAAKKAYSKLDKYYPTSDGAVYIIGSSKLMKI